MFDTIRLETKDLDLDTGRLRSKGWSRFQHETMDCEGEIHGGEVWRPNTKGKHPHFVQYTPSRGELKLETSLPKVLYNENVSLLKPEDIGRTFDEISNRVADWTGGAIPPVGDWDVRGRIDGCFAWQVGSKVADYLHAFRSVELPRHISQAVDREATIYWRNRQRVLRLYDKHREQPEIQKAEGLLRFEVQLNHAKGELDRMGIHTTKAKEVLTWKNSHALLNTYLDGLGGDLLITNDERCFKLLVSKVGATRAARLFGYVQLMRLYGKDGLVGEGISRPTVWRAIRDINAAGASVGTVKSGMLKPLTLPIDYTGQPGRV